MKLLDYLDLKEAFLQLKKSQYRSPCPDFLLFNYLEQNLDSFIELLSKDIQQGAEKYVPFPFYKIEIPKTESTTRPIIITDIRDRILYQSIANLVAEHFKPFSQVYSLSSKKGKNQSRTPVKDWKRFMKKVLMLSNKYQWVVKMDLTAFYEYIYHEYLFENIRKITAKIPSSVQNEMIEFLGKLLSHWSEGKPFGLPQSEDASHFFSHICLHEFDLFLRKKRIVFIRFVDDIYIFSNSKIDAKKILIKSIGFLRELGLTISSAKTKIMTSKESKKFVSLFMELDEVDNFLEDSISNSTTILKNEITEKLNNLFFNRKYSKNDRVFKFCIHRYYKLKKRGIEDKDFKKSILNKALNSLEKRPDLIKLTGLYLTLFKNDKEYLNKIVRKILKLLDSDKIVFAWQYAKLLEILIHLVDKNSFYERKTYNLARSIVFTRKKVHPYVYSMAIILFGKLGDDKDREKLKKKFWQIENSFVRKAIILAVRELSFKKRTNFYEKIKKVDTEFEYMISYLNSNIYKYDSVGYKNVYYHIWDYW